MMWILLVAGLWALGCVFMVALTTVASRADRPTADHLARVRRATLWVPPRPERAGD